MVSSDAKLHLGFSIGICAYNERVGVSLLLSFLSAQRFRYNLRQVFVVSTCSRDGTDEAVESYAKRGAVKLYRETERKGKYTCVNTLINEARLSKSDILVLIPADVVPYRDAVDSILDCFSNPDVGCVSGHPIPQNVSGFTEHIGDLLWELHHETFATMSRKGLTHATGELMAFRPNLVPPLSADTVIDDTYIANSIVRAHYRILYAPEAKVAIWVPRNLRDFWIQRLRNIGGHRMLRGKGFSTQEIATLPMRFRLGIIIRVARRRIELLPYLPVLIFIEAMLHLRARFVIQPTAWRMVSSAKPDARAFRRND